MQRLRSDLLSGRGSHGAKKVPRPIVGRCPNGAPSGRSCCARLHTLVTGSDTRLCNRAAACWKQSAGPPRPTKVLPGTALRVALGMQDPGTRILRGVELKNHPFWIGNSRIRRRIESPDVIV